MFLFLVYCIVVLNAVCFVFLLFRLLLVEKYAHRRRIVVLVLSASNSPDKGCQKTTGNYYTYNDQKKYSFHFSDSFSIFLCKIKKVSQMIRFIEISSCDVFSK